MTSSNPVSRLPRRATCRGCRRWPVASSLCDVETPTACLHFLQEVRGVLRVGELALDGDPVAAADESPDRARDGVADQLLLVDRKRVRWQLCGQPPGVPVDQSPDSLGLRPVADTEGRGARCWRKIAFGCVGRIRDADGVTGPGDDESAARRGGDVFADRASARRRVGVSTS